MLKNKDGKPIDTSGLDEKIVQVLNEFAGAIPGQVGAAIQASVKPLETKIEESLTNINTKLESLPAPKDDKGGQGNKNDQGGEGGETDNAVLEAINKLNARLDSVETKTKEEQEAAQAQSLTNSFIEKNFPNLKGKNIIVARITAAKPKSEDEVKEQLDAIKAEHAEIHGEESAAKVFSASAEDEGAQTGNVDDEEAEANAKIEKLDQELKDNR